MASTTNPDDSQICIRCLRRKKIKLNYYRRRDGTYLDTCKECVTAHVDNWDESTFTWILKDLDLPYIPQEWNIIRDRVYEQNSPRTNNTTVIGKYIAKMKLVQFKNFTWADTESLQEKYESTKKEKDEAMAAMMKSMEDQLAEGAITEAQFNSFKATQTAATPAPRKAPDDVVGSNNMFREENYLREDEIPDPSESLTQEDRIYLAMKWGRLYKPSEWIQLEKKYTEMMNSFDIQDADTTASLLMICKLDLKMNQALDMGDMETFAKLSRSYEAMRKSAKFTAAQNKEDRNEYIDCIGELVAMCERDGEFIPKYVPDSALPQDKVDKTLADINRYTYTLVTQDLGLGEQIERQLKQMQIQQEMERQEQENKAIVMSDEDLEKYYNQQQDEREADFKLLYGVEEDS